MDWRQRARIYRRLIEDGEDWGAVARSEGVPLSGPHPAVEAQLRDEINMRDAMRRERRAIQKRRERARARR